MRDYLITSITVLIKQITFCIYIILNSGALVKTSAINIVSVSYTHLDVYKRQGYNSVCRAMQQNIRQYEKAHAQRVQQI